MKLRTRQTDWIVFGGWTALLVLGQMLLPFSSSLLQIVAVLWMCGGVFVLRKASCLPFLLMTLPAFLCEIHRPWAWAQMVMACCFLLRMLRDERLNRREWLILIGIVSAVFLLSWPLDFMERLRGIFEQPKRIIAWQFFHPEAVWGMFSFRQTFDRSLIAALAALLVLRGAWFSTPRVAYAFAYAAVMALLAGFAAALIPWHEPHRFLGTTNVAVHRGHLFQGAGTNVHYLAHTLVFGLPWLCRPLRAKRYGWTLGLLGLFVPVLWIRQRAMVVAMLAMVMLATLFRLRFWRRGKAIQKPEDANLKSMTPDTRHPTPDTCADSTAAVASSSLLFRPIRQSHSPLHWPLAMRARAGFVLAVCLAVSGLWLMRSGIGDSDSRLRRHIRRLYRVEPLRDMTSSSSRDGGKISREPETIPLKLASVVPTSRLVEILKRVDFVRGETWARALTHVRANYFWRGAGAGAWAPFHRANRTRDWTGTWYWAHAHNTYVDVLFEYGMVPVAVAALLAVFGLVRLVRGKVYAGRLWLLYIVGLAALAISQHLLFSFRTLPALLPAFVLLGRAVRAQFADIPIARGF